MRVEGQGRVPATLQTDYLITDPGEVWGAEGDVGKQRDVGKVSSLRN